MADAKKTVVIGFVHLIRGESQIDGNVGVLPFNAWRFACRWIGAFTWSTDLVKSIAADAKEISPQTEDIKLVLKTLGILLKFMVQLCKNLSVWCRKK